MSVQPVPQDVSRIDAPFGKLSRRGPTRLAWVIAAISLLLMAVSLWILIRIAGRWPEDLFGSWLGQLFFTVSLTGYPILGAIIVRQQPRNVYGWLWLFFGLNWAMASFVEPYAALGLFIEPGSLPLVVPLAVVSSVNWVLAISIMPFLILLFPNGRYPSRRWRWFTSIMLAVIFITLLTGIFAPLETAFVPVENPLAIHGAFGAALSWWVNIGINIIIFSIVITAFATTWRFRTARGVERQQLKWFALAAFLFGLILLIDVIPYRLPEVIDTILDSIILASLYFAIAVAILRYRLYDIDVIIRRTLVYAVLTGLLALVYFGSVIVLQQVFRLLTGQDSPLAVVLSTLAIAALFTPARGRVQEWIDRRFYRRRYDSVRALDTFGVALRSDVDLERLNMRLLSVVDDTLQPEILSIWLFRRPLPEP